MPNSLILQRNEQETPANLAKQLSITTPAADSSTLGLCISLSNFFYQLLDTPTNIPTQLCIITPAVDFFTSY